MQYLEKIGKNARKAFEELKTIKHSNPKPIMQSLYNHPKNLVTPT